MGLKCAAEQAGLLSGAGNKDPSALEDYMNIATKTKIASGTREADIIYGTTVCWLLNVLRLR